MHDFLTEMLECPACHGGLTWTVLERRGAHIEEGYAECAACGTIYPIREGVGLFLTPDLPRNDLWEHTESRLMQFLRAHPDVERQLMDTPLDTLSPADQFFRALVLEERGDYAQAQAVAKSAHARLYTPEYLACHASQVHYVAERLATTAGPIVDLASGRGELVEMLAQRLRQPIIATDFSPRVLRRDRRWLEFLGLYERVSLLACDARHTPFKDGAVKTLTTNLGLANIEQPDHLLVELRRIVSGELLAISFFFPPADQANAAAIRQAGLAPFLFRTSALEHFRAAHWQVEIANTCTGIARPTPTGVIVEGAGIDALPVSETILEWCMLIARRNSRT